MRKGRELFNAQRLTITTSSLAKIDQNDNFTRAVSCRYCDRDQQLRTNQIKLQDWLHCPLGKITKEIE